MIRLLPFALAVPLLFSSAVLVAGDQAPPSPSRADGIQAQLLQEVRALRLAIERQASVGARVQLLSGRATLQDERVFKITQQLDMVRNEMSGIERQLKEWSMREKQVEEAAELETDARQRQEMELARKMFKSEFASQQSRLETLRVREQELFNTLSLEQAKLEDVTRRLDDLERELSAR